LEEARQEVERFRGKYEKQIAINKEIEEEVAEMRS
jgi:hypothetical protein